jgi:hypothetical protein
MAILSFQKPDKIVLQKANDFEGQFEFRPLEPGFGLTLGNFRRFCNCRYQSRRSRPRVCYFKRYHRRRY